MQIWQERSSDTGLNEDLSLEIPSIIKNLLEARGLCSDEKVHRHFKSSLKDLRDPFLLRDMDKACERLFMALKAQENLLIYGDFDLDGSTGVSLLYDAFTKFGFQNLFFYQPSRLTEGYGFHASVVKKLKEEKSIDLVVTVDVGIAAIEAVDTANQLGVDVIITDHHLPQEKLPEATAVINPNSGLCDSGLGHLSGVGVGFYLVLAFRKYLKQVDYPAVEFDPKSLLDLYTIGTLTDMVPVIDENRSLIKHGLLQLKRTQRPGLRYLLKELSFENRDLTSQDVAIGISPKINALSRMEESLLPVDLFLVKEVGEAQKLVKEVVATNQLRKDQQASAEAKVLGRLKNFSEPVVFEYDESFHKGVIGLVATKITQNFNVPAFIGAMGEDSKIVGSARAPGGFTASLPDILEHCKEALISFGGHKSAAGFSLMQKDVSLFREKLKEYFVNNSTQNREAKLIYDIEAQIKDFTPNTMKWLEQLGPYGTEFPVPIFKLERVLLQSIRELRGGHLRWTLKQKNSDSVTALYFSPPPKALDINEGKYINLLVEAQWNYFMGNRSIQLLIKDYKPE